MGMYEALQCFGFRGTFARVVHAESLWAVGERDAARAAIEVAAARVRARRSRSRVAGLRAANLYFYNRPVTELRGGARVLVDGREMGMYASYGYLGLFGHPRIGAAARAAIEKYGTGTHGVRTLAGTLTLHRELEETIADFKHAQAAITYSSGYRHEPIGGFDPRRPARRRVCDKLNHALDRRRLSAVRRRVLAFPPQRHGGPGAALGACRPRARKLVIADAVFSMDGDIINLPAVVELCRKHKAWLMIDEAHSLGVLGATGGGSKSTSGWAT